MILITKTLVGTVDTDTLVVLCVRYGQRHGKYAKHMFVNHIWCFIRTGR